MTLVAVTGAAGVGKTHSLMESLTEVLAARPLQDGQRVLAVTFMHGSRRRLESRLAQMRELKGRFVCTTIDSFARDIYVRWDTLRRALGLADLGDEDYDAVCDTAGQLMERPTVSQWISAAFPLVVVDEAQDLKPQRLRMLQAVEPSVTMFAAADEFQCLDTTLRPSPAMGWIDAAGPRILTAPRRTAVPSLIAAANRIRQGDAIQRIDNRFVVGVGSGIPLAATFVANALAWNDHRNVAVVTPSRKGGFADSVIRRVAAGPVGSRQNGPYTIEWEASDDASVTALLRGIRLPRNGNYGGVVAELERVGSEPAAQICRSWVIRQRSLGKRATFSPALVRQRLKRAATEYRHHGPQSRSGIRAMTVYQAKNREFDGVIVIWPYTVAGAADQQRRLLYNAVTRAKRWCTVIVQGAAILQRPPFTR